MLINIKKYKFDQNLLIKILFSIFPLIMLMPSGYITVYLAFFIMIYLFKVILEKNLFHHPYKKCYSITPIKQISTLKLDLKKF